MQQKAKLTKSLAMVTILAACAAALAAVNAAVFFTRAQKTAHHLQSRAGQVWQREVQSRGTLPGRLRGALAALGVVNPASDPLEECGVQLEPQTWWEAMWRLRENSRRLACLEQHARQAAKNHHRFKRRLADRFRMCLDVVSAALLFVVAVHLLFDAPKPGTDTPCYGTLSGDVGVVLAGEAARGDTGAATTAASAGRAGKKSPEGAGRRDALSWPSICVQLAPHVSWTVYLLDSAVPAWFTPEDHQALHDLVLREAKAWGEPLLSGSITPADMQKRLLDKVQDFLPERELLTVVPFWP